ncbi:MAG: polyhydroxyalkanoate depolymerase [Rickettsiaceae bacterium]|nr:polyhydroxyalkanoate depolymerase [Rickettsiaceae bacterium]
MTKFHINSFNQIYNITELARMQNYPFRNMLQFIQKRLEHGNNPIFNAFPGSMFKAYVTLLERITRKYKKPCFGIEETIISGKQYKVEIKEVTKMPFCNLLHFKKIGFPSHLPKLLIFAPMAGHHATLLRNTVEELLPFFDVYITDWIDAAKVPLSSGSFNMDDYIDYCIKFIKGFEEKVHVLAVCQPTVPVLAAISIMSAEKKGHLPASMILMGGPVDASKNPTFPDDFATQHNIEWFENSVISTVPYNYPGAGRKVYPGIMQISGFISLNLQKHINAHLELFHNIVNNKEDAVRKHIKFYDEYLAVMDLPAEFYLQTISEVFQKFSLAKGTLVSRGRKVDLGSITEVPLLGIEGEKDDIAAVGQTLAALDLCKNIPQSKKHYYMQEGVGHYGVFSGSKFREKIVPVIRDFAYKYIGHKLYSNSDDGAYKSDAKKVHLTKARSTAKKPVDAKSAKITPSKTNTSKKKAIKK